ncbi:MAG TPA: hypothetical protein VE890_09365, partial [Thermoguttaceae bacterium]|nr:hypothetical protein [Thermoguttaceae bacterium]
RNPDQIALARLLAERAIAGLGEGSKPLRQQLQKVAALDTPEAQREHLNLYARVARFRKAWTNLRMVDFDAMDRAIRDLAATFPTTYSNRDDLLQQLEAYRRSLPELERSLHNGEDAALDRVERIVAFQRETLLSNPLLDFDRLLVIRRKPLGNPRRAKGPNRGMGEFFGLPQQSAWQLDRIRQPYGWENEIAVLSDLRSDARLTTLYRPPTPRLISDIELRFDARKISFSMPGSHYHWQIFEMDADGTDARQITPTDQPDVHNFDGCYLPNGKMAFISTAPLQGVPCSNGIAVAMTYLMDADGTNIRRLCFDQDHNHCPTVMNDGRILYLRWDYTDLPHQWPRILMTMNPDGSGQREYYGSNSYWPNAIFFARPVPNHRTKIVGIVTGHHVGRVGELIVFDPAVGRQEADGVVQRIPGHGKPVEPIIMDKLTIDSWPKFSHPYPLSENYIIVSCKPTPDALWGIYLVDTFDNMVLLKEVEGEALFEPIPLHATPTPPVIPSRIDPTRPDAVVYIGDIYEGKGLRGVPRGTVERLRLLTYSFAYPYKSGGQHRVGTDGPWEPKRVLGTVPVEADGSAMFRVPANLPISIQPLDAQGKAIQLMRSWTTAMPGELVSCVGCHEDLNGVPPARVTKAAMRAPSEIEPWLGPPRGFSFAREVQPVLDQYCVGCHDGNPSDDGTTLCDLRREQGRYVCLAANDPKPVVVEGVGRDELAGSYSGVFEPAFFELRRFVRTGGLESDLHVLPPGEFHADTTELFQMLAKGHHGVELDDEAWRRLATWVDLNAPCYGTWREVLGVERTEEEHQRRLELRELYSDVAQDLEQTLEEQTVEVAYCPI